MHLTKVTLKNYGVYRDKVEFDLTTTPDKQRQKQRQRQKTWAR